VLDVVVVVVLALPLDWVTVTVTVVLEWDLVFVRLVWVALLPRVEDVFDDLVEVSLSVLGGATVTVLELVVAQDGSFTLLLPQRRLCGGPLELAAVVVSVPAEVSVPLPASALVVGEGESEHAWVPMILQRDRPMPVVVEVSEGTATAASWEPVGAAGADPPAASTLTGTAAITASGIHSRARARIRADRSRRCTALPSQGGTWPPAPARMPGSVHMFAPRHPPVSEAVPVARWPDAEDGYGANA
jgi:hypothetical protein